MACGCTGPATPEACTRAGVDRHRDGVLPRTSAPQRRRRHVHGAPAVWVGLRRLAPPRAHLPRSGPFKGRHRRPPPADRAQSALQAADAICCPAASIGTRDPGRQRRTIPRWPLPARNPPVSILSQHPTTANQTFAGDSSLPPTMRSGRATHSGTLPSELCRTAGASPGGPLLPHSPRRHRPHCTRTLARSGAAAARAWSVQAVPMPGPADLLRVLQAVQKRIAWADGRHVVATYVDDLVLVRR